MKTKNFLIVLFLMIAGMVQAQEKQSTKADDKSTGMGMAGIESCMDQIATDKNLRTEMMNRMMENMKNDTASMREMCRMMMKDPGMRKTMMEMMNKGEMGSGMGKMMDHDNMEDMDHTKTDSMMMHHK